MKPIILCSLAILIPALAAISVADERFPLSGTISHGPVNVRSGANINFEVVTKLDKGEDVIIIGKSFEWYKIELPQKTPAYLRADYVKEIGQRGGQITGSKVNVRSKPDSNSAVLGQVMQGDIVKLVKKSADWWQVEPPSKTSAWVHSSFISVGDVLLDTKALRRPLKVEDVAVPPVPKPRPVPPVVPFSIEGVLTLLAENVVPNVHYKIIVQGKTGCYLEDASGMERFKGATVHIEGIKDNAVSMLLSYPVIKITNISLVL